MSIKKGLRFDDDEYQPTKNQQSIKFEADRKKTNFQKDVDDLLFSGMAPAPRRRRGAEQPAPPKPDSLKKQQPKAPTHNQPSSNTGGNLPINSNKNIQPKKPNLNKSTDSQKAEKQKPSPPSKYTPAPSNPTPAPSKPIHKPQVDNYVNPPKEVIEEQPQNPHQKDAEEKAADVDNLLTYNRPAYIRKLKKTAQDFNFHNENPQSHVAFDVVRPSECWREQAKKLNSPGYVDDQFPPDSVSIGHEHRADFVVFKKPSEIFKSAVFGKYIDPNDIQPGSMSSPQFISTLSCLAEREENIKRLIENQKVNENGCYYVRINVNGVWRYVAVDDSLPSLDGVALGARSYNDSEGDLWASLIEKAYAKVHNGYNVFKNTTVPREHYLRDLTGVPVRKIEPRDQDFGHAINDAIDRGCPVIAVPKESIMDLGFNPNYSLSVLRSNSKGALELRSSFGTIHQRPKVGLSREGMFQISSNQTRDYISHVMIAETHPALHSSTVQSKHYGSFYSCYNIRIRDSNPDAFISVSQIDKRFFSPKQGYQYAPFRVIVEKKNVDGDNSAYVTGGFSHSSRNLDLAVNLSAGSYYVYCIGQWADKPYDFNLTLHSNGLVEPTKIYTNNFPNIISECLTQEGLSNGKRSAKGNVDEYILYHEPTNLVLITANSLTDKSYNYTLNLNQVKFDTLTLLNTVQPGDTFSKKSRQELDDYKYSCLGQKTWDANLLPYEKYTWVFSSSLDYDPSNLKTWGFR